MTMSPTPANVTSVRDPLMAAIDKIDITKMVTDKVVDSAASLVKPNEAPAQEQQKLSMWQKAKVAVKGFVKNAAEAIPRTLLFSGGAFVASAAAHSLIGPGADFLKVVGSDGAISVLDVGKRIFSSVGIASGISGVLGTAMSWTELKSQYIGAQAPQNAFVQEQAVGQQLSQSQSVTPTTGLPHIGQTLTGRGK